MTNNCYIIDTSSLVGLKLHSPIDVFPGVWNKLESLINSGRLFSPEEVYFEIKKKDDDLYKWVTKVRKKLFRKVTQRQVEIVSNILKDYPSLAHSNKESIAADPWLIALAIELKEQKQLDLDSAQIKRIIVTEECVRGNKVKIPFVCNKFSIIAINVIEMFRTEGWIFISKN